MDKKGVFTYLAFTFGVGYAAQFALHRALTIRGMATADMRAAHDRVPRWVYEDPKGAEPFSQGTIRMDEADMGLAMDMFYEAMGWDKATGAPTASAYARLGLDAVGRALAAKGLAPKDEG